ncbi:O-antigen ligase family protein [Patescibacteria group bacterium AH-259-L07]|nr:O-antigen ligase family protein [Patescibacteria group bacterium AH-259-L07]
MKYTIANIVSKTIFQKYFLWITAVLFAVFIGIFVSRGTVEYDIFLGFLLILLIVLAKPIAGLLFAIPLTLWYPSTELLWAPPRNYLIFFMGIIALMALSIKGKLKINRHSKKILTISIIFVLLAISINLIHDTSLTIVSVKGARLLILFLVGFCTMFFITNKKYFYLFLKFLIVCMSISAFVGIGQFLGIDFFWKLREIAGFDPSVPSSIISRTRIAGLSLFSIPLSYQLASVTPLLLGLLTIKKGGGFSKKFLLIAFILCFLALLMTQARSAIIGGFIGLITVIFLGTKKRKKRKIKMVSLGIVMVLIIFFLNIQTEGSFTKRFLFQDQTTQWRISAFQASAKTFARHPLIGVGTGRAGAQEYEAIAASVLADRDIKRAKIISPHNQFINVLLYYGIFGLLLLILFYYYIFKGLFYLYHKIDDKTMQGVVIGLIGLFVAYIFHSSFHNNGPFISDFFNWFFVGITMFLLNYSNKMNKYEKLPQ